MTTIVLVTGGFDPLHSGHIEYFKAAKNLGDKLVVGVNSDAWLIRKKGRPFMPWTERCVIIENLSMVDQVIGVMNDDRFDDAGGAIFKLLSTNSSNVDIIVANGGDRKQGNVPEEVTYGDNQNVSFVYGVGGENKQNSSSWILKDWSSPKVERAWGHYRNLYKGNGFMVKELVINPHSSLSMQKHQHRSETWNLVSGTAHVLISNRTIPKDCAKYNLTPPNPLDIPSDTWHKGVNNSDQPAHIVEVWKGNILTEEDIERYD